MVNYGNSKIYAIRSYATDNVYIGSTTQPLSKRMVVHRGHYKLYLAGKFRYMTSFELIKCGDAYIELLEDYPCENNEQLHRREGELIRNTACVNMRIAGQSKKEYWEAHVEQRKANNKKNYDAHAEQRRSYGKQYYDAHAEQRISYVKQYYATHKDKIRTHQLEKIPCPHCSVLIARKGMSRHQRTPKCQSV